MCKLFSANARGEQVDGSRAGEVASGFINKKCAIDPNAECAVPFTYSVSYYQTEICVFVWGLDPTSTNFHTNFISTIITLNRNRPEFKILGDSPGQWTSWTDGHILEEEIFTIELNQGNYWYFKKQVCFTEIYEYKLYYYDDFFYDFWTLFFGDFWMTFWTFCFGRFILDNLLDNFWAVFGSFLGQCF